MIKVLYHANCNDGSGAALVAWLWFQNQRDLEVDYIPVQYGSKPPEGLENTDVYILDFSYKRQVLLDLAEKVNSITLLDHHKSAQEDLSGQYPENVYIKFDMNRSGAVLAWNYFFSGESVPLLLRYIQDRDLWLKKMKDTDKVALALGLYPDFKDWKPFLDDCKPLIDQGDTLLRFKQQIIDRIISSKEDVCVTFANSAEPVPVYNIQGFLISDLLHAALEKYPQANFAVGYFDLPKKRIFSLRSRAGSDVDVSKIAGKFGGGGHKHAAGFVLEHPPGHVKIELSE